MDLFKGLMCFAQALQCTLDFLIAFQCTNVVEVQQVQIILICVFLFTNGQCAAVAVDLNSLFTLHKRTIM